jgi:uncharacterized protein (DUF1778 family)
MASSKKAGSKAGPVRRKQVRKEDQIRLRVTAEQKEILVRAAEKDGSGLSFWLLQAGLRAARALEEKS